MQIHAGIITVSDRAAQGLYADRSGPALKQAAEDYGWQVAAETSVPDEKPDIQRALRELPGFGEVMRLESIKINRHAILSRNLAAVVDRTLVICLPGKPAGAVECLGFVAGAVPHCLEILPGAPAGC